MRLIKLLVLVSLVAAMLFINGCGCGPRHDIIEGTGDLMIGVIVSQPLVYYYGTTGLLEVWGPDGVYLAKEVPMYLGNQVVMFRNLPIGRYVASLSYSGMVVTKCAVLCGTGEAQWRADCAEGLKCVLKGKTRSSSWDYRDDYGGRGGDMWAGWAANDQREDFAVPSPSVGHREPCQTILIFNMPEDALRYDP